MNRWIGAMWIATVCLLVAGCSGTKSFSGGSNWKTSELTAVWSPDPNGGVGIRMMTDSLVPEGTKENIAVGPYIDFRLTQVTGKLLDGVLPGDWNPLLNAPFDVYGSMSLLWQMDGGKFLFAPATETRFFPNRMIQPFVRVEYIKPENGAGIDEGVLPFFGARINVK